MKKTVGIISKREYEELVVVCPYCETGIVYRQTIPHNYSGTDLECWLCHKVFSIEF